VRRAYRTRQRRTGECRDTPLFEHLAHHLQVDTDLRAPAGNPVCFADALIDTSSSTRILIRCAPSASGDGCSYCPVRPERTTTPPSSARAGECGTAPPSPFLSSPRLAGRSDSPTLRLDAGVDTAGEDIGYVRNGEVTVGCD